jgi:UDP-N-acetylmuramate dehydrogenase
MRIEQHVLLKDYAWWKIGGPADYFALPTSQIELEEAVAFALDRHLPITVLGGGTNVLISDQGIEGLTICMREFKGVQQDDDGKRLKITALAGTPKSELTKIFIKRKMAPALFLCGLPGDVGGGIVMNAGVAEKIQPREFVELVDWIEILDTSLPQARIRRLMKDEIKWTYRHTEGWQPGIITRVGVSWPIEEDPEMPRKVKDATKSRLQRQPLDLPSCGSTFKNPPGEFSAGALIEKAGLKGYRAGGAQVSPKHANFIVNLGGATSADVKQFILHVKNEVKKQFGADLKTEVKFLGRF